MSSGKRLLTGIMATVVLLFAFFGLLILGAYLNNGAIVLIALPGFIFTVFFGLYGLLWYVAKKRGRFSSLDYAYPVAPLVLWIVLGVVAGLVQILVDGDRTTTAYVFAQTAGAPLVGLIIAVFTSVAYLIKIFLPASIDPEKSSRVLLIVTLIFVLLFPVALISLDSIFPHLHIL